MKKLKNFSVISMFPLEKHIVCHVYYKQYKLVQYKYYAPIIFYGGTSWKTQSPS